MRILFNSILLFSIFNHIVQCEVCFQNETEQYDFDSTSQKIHKIRKRSLAFPKGSAFVMTLSTLKALPVKGFTWNQDHEFDVIWPIPSESDKLRLIKPKLKPKSKFPVRKTYFHQPYWKNRRHRRELYSNLELALNYYNLPGKTCILRTICEAKTLLNPPGVSLVEDILRVILRSPITSKKNTDEYDEAHKTKKDCDIAYPCPFSLLNFLLNFNNNSYD